MNSSSRVAPDSQQVQRRTEQPVSIAADHAKHAQPRVRSQLRAVSQSGPPPDSMRSQFKLPPNTTRKDLLSIPFLQDVFQTAMRHGCVREIEWQDFVGLAVNCCSQKQGTPAGLFTWAMRGGRRQVKRGTKLVEVPWTAAVPNEHMDKARELINQAKPPEYRVRTSSLETTQAVAKAQAIKALSAKYGNILAVK